MAKHIYAKLMELYAKDAVVSDSPWKFWEVLGSLRPGS